MPDKLRFAFYPVILPDTSFSPDADYTVLHLTDTELMKKTLSAVADYCKKENLPYTKPELAEWNFSISQREYLNDTCFTAAYIVKNMLDSHYLSEDVCYWAFYDYLGETSRSQDTFFGGPGLLAAHGIKKPAFYAFDFLSRLGQRVFARGDGYIITKTDADIQILFYNYCSYSALYAQGKNYNNSFSNRYDAFIEQKAIHYSVLLKDLPSQRYLCTTRILNREHGSAFDQWIKMGMITIITPDEIEYMRGVAQPEMKVRIIFPDNGTCQITRELQPFELCLIELHVI